jgi:hypothetical protein
MQPRRQSMEEEEENEFAGYLQRTLAKIRIAFIQSQ